MRWDQVLTLLQVAKMAHDWGPALHHIRNEAERQLRELDSQAISHGDEVPQQEEE